VIALMIAGYLLSGRLARRRATGAPATAATEPGGVVEV
jgi:hypothetical protein